ncbi:hypothetical protein DWW31_13730 [Clostridium sp. AF15-17LB]|nr:hypothetical protein DWW31_13730 [Clostridium sp. AF15-17LB]
MKRLTSMILALCMVFAWMPMAAFAAGTGSIPTEIWVSGVDILQDSDKTLECGGGTAVYEESSNTLTLNAAKITAREGREGAGIYANGDLNIVHGGNNLIDSTVVSEGGEVVSVGVKADGALHISGSGSLHVDTEFVAFVSRGDMTLTGGVITAASDKSNAFWANGGAITVSGGDITAVSNNYPALWADMNLTITGGKVNATSSGSNGMGAVGSLSVSGTADVTAQGSYPGMFATGDITFNGGKIKAVGNDDDGIYSTGVISINGGSVYAKGGAGCTAIRAKSVQTAGEAAASKIELSNLVEKNGGKVAFSDWFDSGGEVRSFTTFIGKDDTALNTSMSNALREVWLAVPYTVTFDVNSGDGSPFTEKVYPNDKVAKPSDPTRSGGYIFSGWFNGDTAFDFASTTITEDMTLTANWHAHTYGADWKSDAANHWHECTAGDGAKMDLAAHTPGAPPSYERGQTCTVCDYEMASKIPSKKVIVNDKTGATVEYEDGSIFDTEIKLVVTPKTAEEMRQYKDSVDKAAPGFSIAGLYDVKLMKDGAAIQPGGMVKVSLPLTDEMKAMTDLQVVYIDDNGNVTIIPSQIMDGKIIFITDHFSLYGVIGKGESAAAGPADLQEPGKDSPQTGDSSNLPLMAALLFVSGSAFIGTVVIGKKKRRSE